MPQTIYAWCFDHGTLHRFQPRQEPWCTAAWIHLDAHSEEAALAMKQQTWGEARFLHELSLEQQETAIRRWRHTRAMAAEVQQ